jgi:hypothetical protein
MYLNARMSQDTNGGTCGAGVHCHCVSKARRCRGGGHFPNREAGRAKPQSTSISGKLGQGRGKAPGAVLAKGGSRPQVTLCPPQSPTHHDPERGRHLGQGVGVVRSDRWYPSTPKQGEEPRCVDSVEVHTQVPGRIVPGQGTEVVQSQALTASQWGKPKKCPPHLPFTAS